MAFGRRDGSPHLFAGLLAAVGVLHLVMPKPFVRLVPRVLPAPEFLVAASGVAELACAAALLAPPTRRIGALASAALLVGVFPANVQMALDARRSGPGWYRAVAYGRLPLQVPLVGWALDIARRQHGEPPNQP